MTEISSKPVLAIGSDRTKRGRAAKLALLCRSRYEAAMTNATTNTFTCPDLHAVFSVNRFSLPVAAHVSGPARAIEDQAIPKTGVWSEPDWDEAKDEPEDEAQANSETNRNKTARIQ